MEKYVIIGCGAAGCSAAEKLRQKNADCEIHIFTKEQEPFYYRPRLTDCISGEVSFDNIILHGLDWFKDNGISLHLSCAVSDINVSDKHIMTEFADKYSYSKLLMACGADCFVPSFDGLENAKEDTFTLKTVEDAKKIISQAQLKKDVCIIGGGVLGIETACSLAKIGCAVTVAERAERLLPRQLDRGASDVLINLLKEKGIEFALSEETAKLEKAGSKYSLKMKSGRTIETGMIIISAGVRANISLAKKAGLNTDRGILTDSLLRTSQPDIFAAGDAAECCGVMSGQWMPAKIQGETSGINMLGGSIEYIPQPPSCRLKVTGIDLLSAGSIDEGGENVTDTEHGIYRKAFISDGKLSGIVLLGNIKGSRALENAVKNKTDFETVANLFYAK